MAISHLNDPHGNIMADNTHTPASTLEDERTKDLDKRLNAEFLASRLMLINPILLELDLEFIKQAAKDMYNDASRMDSAAVLIRNYSPTKSQLLCTQGKAMMLLAEYIEAVNECSTLKSRIDKEEQHHNQMSQLFGL